MARMKIDFLHHWHAKHPISTREKLTAYLPRYAAAASRFAPLLNLRNSLRGLAVLGEKLTGMSAKRKLPTWRTDIYRTPPVKKAGKETLLFVDCFARYFEPENARAARGVLEAGGDTILVNTCSRPLCCGRTFPRGARHEQAPAELVQSGGASCAHPPRGGP